MSARTHGEGDVPWHQVSRQWPVAVFTRGQAGGMTPARDVGASVPTGSGGRRRERGAGLVAVSGALLSGMALLAATAPPAAALARAVPVPA